MTPSVFAKKIQKMPYFCPFFWLSLVIYSNFNMFFRDKLDENRIFTFSAFFDYLIPAICTNSQKMAPNCLIDTYEEVHAT